MGKILVFLLLLVMGCASPSEPEYKTLYGCKGSCGVEKSLTKTQKLTPEVGYYKPRTVGDFGDDWYATLKSANGIVLSVQGEDDDFIYIWADTTPILLQMVLGSDTLVSSSFYPPTSGDTTVEIVYTGSFTLGDFNGIQGVVVHSDTAQSYQFFPQPEPLGIWTMDSAKISVIISHTNDQPRVDKIEKVLFYEIQ